ncbi:MAG: amidohydrolase [Rhodospirillales bacterium]|jgi:amidohydrolase|nr:amidohydrolase [Rhodospirillales bacterium]
MDLKNEIERRTSEITNEITAVRHAIHEHPELGFEEVETAARVVSILEKLEIPHKTKIGGTGVVGVIEGGAPGPTVAIRSDMDALPMIEASGVSFASKVPGKMHACGHDVHTAILLGTAMVLNGLRDQLKGRIKLIFQPAEEILEGAAAMIKDGVLDDLPADFFLGYHNWPPLEAGKVGYHPDVVFAAIDAFDVTLKGISGHAAHPHRAIDVITAAAHFTTQLQTTINREIVPIQPVVVGIGQVEAGTSRNILPDSITLRGGARAHVPEVLEQVEQIIRRVLEGLKTGLRIDYELDYRTVVPVVRNDADVIARVLGSARNILGDDNVVQLPEASMGGDDLAWFTGRIPSAHLRIGSKIDGLETMLHRSNYQCNELAIPTAIKAVSQAAVDLLS